MPIQFRCGGCNQLLGIATRKAGAVVHCPTCGGKTIVPRPRETGEKAAVKRNDFSLLERIDVDKLLGAPIPGKVLTPKPVMQSGAGASTAAVAEAPAAKPEPKEMRALSKTAFPDESAIDVDSLADDDDGPMVLDDTASRAALVLSWPALWGVLAGLLVLLGLAGGLGYWLGQP